MSPVAVHVIMAILQHTTEDEGRVVPSKNKTEILCVDCIESLLAEHIKLWYNGDLVMSCMRGQNSVYTARDPAASENWH